MADFGQFDAFLNDPDLAFTWQGKDYEITIPASEVMRFVSASKKRTDALTEYQDAHNKWIKDGREGEEPTGPDEWGNYADVAKLLGGSFDRKNLRFKGCFLAEMQDAGVPMSALNRIITSTSLKFTYSDEVAESFMKHGDVVRAIRENTGKAKREKQVQAEKATQPDTGATSSAGSETPKD